MFKWSKLYPRMDYWSNPGRLNPTIDQHYCSVPLAQTFWYYRVKMVKMVNMIKMVELHNHSLRDDYSFLWSVINGHL